ncbi:hypothetical protein [Bacillus toyonensis]|uniref:hypothetical protein n=1 Tax=Bacillus toyonensis TaxID=155322 RepID=UPI002E24771D|nr:hypothetical protein [Bacillus toyonensis]
MFQVTDEFLEELKQKVADYSISEKIDPELKDILHCIPFVIRELNKEKEERKQLKSSHDKVVGHWVSTLVANIDLMDEHCPGWRMAAEKEIKQLRLLLQDSKNKK